MCFILDSYLLITFNKTKIHVFNDIMIGEIRSRVVLFLLGFVVKEKWINNTK